MNNSDFIHLHVHGEYSLLDGIGKPEQYAKRNVELGFKACAITDHSNIDTHIKWQKAFDKVGIKPILGTELYCVPDMKSTGKESRGHITVLVKNLQGWQELNRMLTVANLEGFNRRPRIDFPLLRSADLSGLILLTGCSSSFLNLPNGEELFKDLIEKTEIYLEVMPHQIASQVKINNLCLQLSEKYNIPLIATNDCHYVYENQWEAQEVLLAVQRQAKWKDPDRWKFGFKGLHLRTADEMVSEFKAQNILNRKQYYEALTKTVEIAEKCWDFRVPKMIPSLPLTRYEKANPDLTAEDILAEICEKGGEEIFGKRWPEGYRERYKREMQVIQHKNFSRYFLIIYELIQYCKEAKIPVGPGRGSVAGSLTSMLAGITRVIDPIKYNLLFERFISEDRKSLPDIDLDFDNTQTDKIQQHLVEEYGEYNVVGISTFMRMKSRSSVRDVGRVFELDENDIDEFAKNIEGKGHATGLIKAAAESTREGRKFAVRYPDQLRLACELEGQCRSSGRHPAGLIISGEDLRDGTRGNLVRRSDNIVINWDMVDCDEHAGLVKIDVLKLSTVVVIDEAVKIIDNLDIENIPLDDPKVYKMLSEGDTAGIFQMSGYACKKLCKEMKPDEFNDIVAIGALARPGPLESGMADLYVKRKHGEEWIPLHPKYEEITKSTYGVMAYQEQMMRSMIDLAGFSATDGYNVLKVIGKKRDPKEFEPYRISFFEGCKKLKTLNERQAEKFWQDLLGWAMYGFNAAHATSYGLLAYQTAYLKCNHPKEFLCATLTYGEDKDATISEAEKKGFRIVSPKIGISDTKKWKIKGNDLYAPFSEIKGIGETAAAKCALMKPKRLAKGFFKRQAVGTTKIEQLMEEIKAFDTIPESGPEDWNKYFQFSVSRKSIKLPVIKKIGIVPEAKECELCGLRKQATRVVLPSIGNYNALILAEAPGCITGDSLIDTAFRDKSKSLTGIPIKDLVGQKDFYVYSLDTENKKLVLGKVNRVWKTGRKKVYKVTYEWYFANGKERIRKTSSINVTENHPFLLRYSINKKDPFKGKQETVDYLSIKDGLTIGHSLQPFHRHSYRYNDIGAFNTEMFIESRFLLEQKLGRKLEDKEDCHHIDENRYNDSFDNLESLSVADHAKYHIILNNPMFNEKHREKHSKIMTSLNYRRKLSRKMSQVLKDPKIYAERLEQISKSKKKMAKTLKKKFQTDPNYYWNYLMGRKNSSFFNITDERIKELFKKRFPDEEIPIDDNHKIVAVECIGVEDVYDMEVEKYHNFAVNGIFVHNSTENEQGVGYVGDSGNLLWDELAIHGITRRQVHVANCAMCFPSKTRTPSREETDICFNKWVIPFIRSMNCKLILATGGVALYALTGREKGITKLIGEVEFVEKVNAHVVWCGHPSWVLRNRNENLEKFRTGIAIFAKIFKENAK